MPYSLMVIQGDEKLLRSFLEGLVVGADAFGEIYFLDELDVDQDSLLDSIKELFLNKDPMVHILVRRRLVELINKGINDPSLENRFRIASQTPVSAAIFRYRVECYSREHGAAILELFGKLPAGVFREDIEDLIETEYPRGKGIEMYSPAHDYILKGKGEIKGAVKEVLDIYEKAKDEPLIKLKEIKFDFE